MAQQARSSEFSINAFLNKKEESTELFAPIEEDLPNEHFSQADLEREWKGFLLKLSKLDSVAYNAINNFKLTKINESQIEVLYSSSTAKAEFDKVAGEFVNHFKHKIKNFSIRLSFKEDKSIVQEVMTKKKLFEKFSEINPVLKDLNDLMRFDLS
ncbi:hypothetical protein [Chryseobacterium sp. POL2]|uniref:hypothetical protein n=1 Tax=Chryseobacterium sp. POL2 TaxID=2713414 RepID=UPI0013E149FB|nr:hypothetical protein [Chryseobacterium sp. POL2]QIG90762.1 hypothetical protein G6R40_14395 [Chryseobacterium sp. POL2]